MGIAQLLSTFFRIWAMRINVRSKTGAAQKKMGVSSNLELTYNCIDKKNYCDLGQLELKIFVNTVFVSSQLLLTNNI